MSGQCLLRNQYSKEAGDGHGAVDAGVDVVALLPKKLSLLKQMPTRVSTQCHLSNSNHKEVIYNEYVIVLNIDEFSIIIS